MNWNDTKLCTLESIARYEKEVNELAGYTARPALMGIEEPITLFVPNEITSIIYIATTGTKYEKTISEAGKWILPKAEMIELELRAAGTLHSTAFLLEGHGHVSALKYETGENINLDLSADAWIVANVNRTWDEKLELAKNDVAGDILTVLLPRFGNITDEDALARITNAETFKTACNLKALELIFTDLGLGTFNQMHEMKAENYARRYQTEISNALTRMRVGDEGSAGERLITIGKITR